MTQREIAKESGFSVGLVNRKLKFGLSVEEIIRAGKERQQHQAGESGAERLPVHAGQAGVNKAGKEPKEEEDYWKAHARKERMLADRAELEYAKETGTLVDSAEVAIKWAALCTTIRDGMLSLPIKLAGKFASMVNEKEIMALMRSEIRSELTRVSKDLDESAYSA